MNDRLLKTNEIQIDWTDEEGNPTELVKISKWYLVGLLQAQDAKTAKHYEEVVIPARIAEAYSRGCMDTADKYSVLLQEAIKTERERVIKDIEEWVRKDIRIEDCNCIGACEDKCETAGAFTEHCPWWQQLKQEG